MNRSAARWSVATTLAIAAVVGVGLQMRYWGAGAIRIKGAVFRRDSDVRRELPISGVDVTVSDGVFSATARSEASGYFNIPFPRGVWPGQTVTLSFRHADYEPLDLRVQGGLRFASGKLYIAAMEPIVLQDRDDSNHPPLSVSNIKIRYTINTQRMVNIGSAVKTFQVVNTGDIPCDHRPPCSPDGKWKAFMGSETMDAGADNEFSNVRASCIAGPCPFTRIDSSGFANGGRRISISALNWSETATFLLEAEVFHTANVAEVRELYPVIFGRALNFTLPPSQEGVSIEAEIDGEPMVFPLSPDLYLSWATCAVRTTVEREKTLVYRCELKPGYRF